MRVSLEHLSRRGQVTPKDFIMLHSEILRHGWVY
jgi:hypothetical protein